MVGIGLLVLLAGLAVFSFPAQEAHTVTADISEWDLQSQVLEPFGQDPDSVFYGRLMVPGWWFQLNLSSTDTIELQVSMIRHNPEEKIPIFHRTGTSFNQTVGTSSTGTYIIDVQNKSPSSITLGGNVLTRKAQTNYNTVYPYALPGFLIILGGASGLILGIFKEGKKPSKAKRTRKRVDQR